MDRARIARLHSRFSLIHCLALAVLATAVSGCGQYKPPKFSEIVENVKGGGEEKEAKKEAPKPTPAQQTQASLPPGGQTDAATPNATPGIVIGDGPAPVAAAATQKPEDIIAGFDAQGSILLNDASIQSFIASLGDRTDLVTKIDMTQAQVTPAGLQHLQKCPKLVELKLNGVQPTPDGWEAVGKLVSLEKLDVSQSNLTDAEMIFLSNLEGLKEFYAARLNNLSDKGVAEFAKFKKLEVLDISSDGRVNGEGFAEARKRGGMGPLRVLKANHTKFGMVGMNSLNGLASLESLEVGNAVVSNGSMGGLRSVPKLKRLLLSENGAVTDAGLVELSRLKQLEHLETRNLGRMSDFGLSQVKNAKQLKFVDVDGTTVTNAGLHGLKKMIPAVQIQWQGKLYE